MCEECYTTAVPGKLPRAHFTRITFCHICDFFTDYAWIDKFVEIRIIFCGDVCGGKLLHCSRRGAERFNISTGDGEYNKERHGPYNEFRYLHLYYLGILGWEKWHFVGYVGKM